MKIEDVKVGGEYQVAFDDGGPAVRVVVRQIASDGGLKVEYVHKPGQLMDFDPDEIKEVEASGTIV